MTVERGCLALGDVTGYTSYLAGVELEHSQDVLADLMNVLVGQMRGVLRLAKLEGDAVFCYAYDADVDGSALVAMVESCYFAFARRLRTIHQRNTCECNACRLIPRLNLKLMVHHGEFVTHEVAGSRELVGRDVILAHRLLKNTVTEKTGLRGYALFTEPCLRRYGIDPAALGMRAHHEVYDDLGSVDGHVLDLAARWKEEQDRRSVNVREEDAAITLEVDVPVPPAIAWEYLTSPTKRLLWQPEFQRITQRNPRGVAGMGRTNHCIHGRGSFDEEIVDWKPFSYYSFRFAAQPFGNLLLTTELQPREVGETRVAFRWQQLAGPVRRLLLRLMRSQFRASVRGYAENLRRVLSAVTVEAAEQRQLPRDGWMHDQVIREGQPVVQTDVPAEAHATVTSEGDERRHPAAGDS